MKTNVMRWKKNPRATGLGRIGAGPRGSTLRDADTEWAWVSAAGGGYRELRGWFFVVPAGLPIPFQNTCHDLVDTEDEAKDLALAYVKKHRKELGV